MFGGAAALATANIKVAEEFQAAVRSLRDGRCRYI
jgi:hypothetical protein